MTFLSPTRLPDRTTRAEIGPFAVFFAVVAVAFVGLAATAASAPPALALSGLSGFFYTAALIVAAVTWKRRKGSDSRVGYWDVAGAFTLFGVCSSSLVDPEALRALLAGHPAD